MPDRPTPADHPRLVEKRRAYEVRTAMRGAGPWFRKGGVTGERLATLYAQAWRSLPGSLQRTLPAAPPAPDAAVDLASLLLAHDQLESATSASGFVGSISAPLRALLPDDDVDHAVNQWVSHALQTADGHAVPRDVLVSLASEGYIAEDALQDNASIVAAHLSVEAGEDADLASVATHRRALQFAESDPSGDQVIVTQHRLNLGGHLVAAGRQLDRLDLIDAGLDQLARCEEAARLLDRPEILGAATLERARALVHLGRNDDARDLVVKAQALPGGGRHTLAIVDVFLALGRGQDAIDAAVRELARAERAGSDSSVVFAARLLADVCCEEKRDLEAARYSALAVDRAGKLSIDDEFVQRAAHAILLAELDEPEQALDAAREACAVAQELGDACPSDLRNAVEEIIAEFGDDAPS